MRTLCWCLLAAIAQGQSPEELRSMLRAALTKLQEADRQLADYSYARYNIRRELTSGGKVKSERTLLARRDFEDGFGFIHPMQRDGKPVPDAEVQQSHESARAQAAQVRSMTPAARAKIEADTGIRSREQAWLKEFPDALEYRKAADEIVNGRRTLVLECSPRKGYKAGNIRARVFEKVRGKIWMDAADGEIVRVDAEVFDTVSIGWGLVGKIQKGTRFHLERRRLANGNWLPDSQSIRFAANYLVFKSLAQEEITRYSEYRHKSSLSVRAE